MPGHFRFKGTAIGAYGRLDEPFYELIPVQAASVLPPTGGYGTARSSGFRHRDVLSADEICTEVIGTVLERKGEPKTFTTLVKATIERFSVMGVVRADRIVANLVSTFREGIDTEPSVLLIGSHFENLRIAGIPVEVDLATDVFDKFDTYKGLSEAYQDDKSGVKGLFGDLLQVNRLTSAPEEVLRWFFHPAEEHEKLPSVNGVTRVSLVRELEVRGKGLKPFGHVIHVAGFGTIRLAEMEISPLSRSLTMVQVELGCPVNGGAGSGAVEDGCSPS